MDHCLVTKRDDGIALITLNRPEALNAVSDEMQRLLHDYLVDCERDAAVRCVALTGAGRGFCAGGDVKRQAEGSSGAVEISREDRIAVLQEGQMQLSHRLHTMAKPTVALVNGPAAGAGMSLALACDLRFCSERASFHTAFSKVGLSGDYGGSYFLQRLIGYGRAIEMYYLGDKVEADRALKLGIANRVASADEFMEAGLEYCARLAKGPTLAYGNIKANFNVGETAELEMALSQEARSMTASAESGDHREGAQAFVERRAPRFTGK
jgi:2-(1,2-epoxy-1,2-dihydrophenyl)acetyl-CoA isomerase